MDLTCARDQIATAVTNHITGTVHAHRPNVVKIGDGWTVLRSLVPSTFASCTAGLDVVMTLATDDQAAEMIMDGICVDLINALGKAGFTPTGLTPVSLTLDGAELFCVAASVLIEVEH